MTGLEVLLARLQAAQARIEHSRSIHDDWVAHLRDDCRTCCGSEVIERVGGPEFHEGVSRDYSTIIATLDDAIAALASDGDSMAFATRKGAIPEAQPEPLPATASIESPSVVAALVTSERGGRGIMDAWQTGKPPHKKVVEVERGNQIIRVRAIWGSDGTLPHWESEDRSMLWAPSAFARWREVNDGTMGDESATLTSPRMTIQRRLYEEALAHSASKVPRVKVIVLCNQIDEQVEMSHDNVMYVNREVGTQSRRYECPVCKTSVTVVLEKIDGTMGEDNRGRGDNPADSSDRQGE